MKNYLFEIVSGDCEGEEFFVQAKTKEGARSVAKEVASWEEIRYLGVYTDEEAEIMGYDTY